MSYSNVHQTDSDKRDPLAPQSLVVANGNVDPDLVKERQRNGQLSKFPLIDPSVDLEIRRGEWFFSRADLNPRRHRHAQMNLDDIIGFTSASGMLGTEKFVFRGCVDYPGERADADGSATPRLGLSMRVVGNASGWNTGPSPIKQGDLVYADWPIKKTDPSGMILPHWQPDWNPTKFYFATRPMAPHSITGAVLKFFRMLADADDEKEVHKVAAEAYSACTPFPDMQGDADPLKRFANFFALPKYKTDKMKNLRAFEAKVASWSKDTDLSGDGDAATLVKEYAELVLYSKELKDEGSRLDQIFSKTDIPSSADDMSPALFQAFRGGAISFISELEALMRARYMGVALAPSVPGGPLDLLLH